MVDVDVVLGVDVVEGSVVVDVTASVVGETGGATAGISSDASFPLPLPRPLPLQPSYFGFLLLPPSTKKLTM